MELNQTIALVTGGASGLGFATAKRLADAGAKVILADLNDQVGPGAQAEIGDNALFIKTDVTSEEDVNAALDAAGQAFGVVNCAVNCAGIAIAKRTLGARRPWTRSLQQGLDGQRGWELQRYSPRSLPDESTGAQRGW